MDDVNSLLIGSQYRPQCYGRNLPHPVTAEDRSPQQTTWNDERRVTFDCSLFAQDGICTRVAAVFPDRFDAWLLPRRHEARRSAHRFRNESDLVSLKATR